MEENKNQQHSPEAPLQESSAVRPHHRLRPIQPRAPHQQLRQVLNIIFMLGAVVGLVVYFATESKQTGIIIILCAMVFKFVEVAIRIIK